jgi:uncharacterized membrane protein YgcG
MGVRVAGLWVRSTPMRGSILRWGVLVATAALAGLVGAGSAAEPVLAQAEGERILQFDAVYEVQADGTVSVVEEIVVDFGTAERHGIFRDLRIEAPCAPNPAQEQPSHPCPAGSERRWPTMVRSVTDGEGRPLRTEETREGSILRVRIGDPDRTVTGRQVYRIAYDVAAALDAYADHDELYWNATGEWPLPVERAEIRVRVAGRAPEPLACFRGPAGSRRTCEARADVDAAVFRAEGLEPGEQLTFAAGWSKGWVTIQAPVYADIRTVSDFVSLAPSDVVWASAGSILAIVVAVSMWWRHGRDRRYRTVRYLTGDSREETVPLFGDHPVVVEYTPPEDLPPALMGVLIDERVDPRDIAATIVDLAVRGFLHIREIERPWYLGGRDWELERRGSSGPLRPWERMLLDALFPTGNVSKLSDLKGKSAVAKTVQKVQRRLYREATVAGWFPRRPDRERSRWLLTGFVIAAVGGGLGYLAGAGFGRALLAAPLAAFGVALMVFSPTMVRRTAAGREMLRRIAGFRLFIATAEKERQRFYEQANIFERYLPYAIAFDCVDKWARAFSGLERVEGASRGWVSGWYVARGNFDLGSFASGLNSFASAAGRASTGGGSGGGGSAGGGGGGGGGGSW